MKKWIKNALAYKKISQAELQRRLHAKYPQDWPDGRQKINNIINKDQGLQAVEMLQISDITDYPLPDSPGHEQVTWVTKLNHAIKFAMKSGAGDEQIVNAVIRQIPSESLPADVRTALLRISARQDDQVRKAIEVLQQLVGQADTP